MQAERAPTTGQVRVPFAAPVHALRSPALLLERSGWPSVALALLFALAARLPYFTRSDFVLNDGGLFVAMSRDLIASRFVLPAYTTYNAEHIPFAYPPFALYVVAATTTLTGLDPLVIARWLPLAANLATVVCVAALARLLLRPAWVATLAAIVFALLP
ncbi:MAG TPA: hypothetical protein VK898_19595, partial [Chloroflexota bacterium]|nr:hypothetical protein [Chloroflexota bacterium]